METIAQQQTAPTDAPVETTESPAATPVETKEPQKDQFSEKLELLAKKERALWRERQMIAQEKQRISEMEAKFKQFEEKKGKAKVNPLDYLNEAGLSYDEITEFMLNGGKPKEKSEIETLREEFERLRNEQSEKERLAKEQATAAQLAEQQRVIDDFKSEISEFIKTNESTYELSAQRDAAEDIFTTISDAYAISFEEWTRNGKIGPAPKHLSIKEAADIVEEFYEKEVLRLAETQKLKARLGIGQQAPADKGGSKTLTNNMASSAASVVPAKNDADRMRRALEKLGG